MLRRMLSISGIARNVLRFRDLDGDMLKATGVASLVMVTGTGKTYTAFQIVYRLLQSCMKRKILYLADRNILVD